MVRRVGLILARHKHFVGQVEEVAAILVLYLLDNRYSIRASYENLKHFKGWNRIDIEVVGSFVQGGSRERFDQLQVMVEEEDGWQSSVRVGHNYELISHDELHESPIEVGVGLDINCFADLHGVFV